MGGDNDNKWFIAGGHRKVKWRQDVKTSSRSCTGQTVSAGANTNRGDNSRTKRFNCQGYGHLANRCPSKEGSSQSCGKPRAGSSYGSSSNINTAASSSRRPPPPKQHLKGIVDRILVDRSSGPTRAAFSGCVWNRTRRRAWQGITAPSAWALWGASSSKQRG